jgi:precorrin-2/cobalt-factor-2 C20-methyltransferase
MNNSKGKLIGIGVGPGDPDLLTVKAVKTLESVPVICSPKSSKNKPSVALSIVQGYWMVVMMNIRLLNLFSQ